MLIKIQHKDGSFLLKDHIRGVRYSANSTYFPQPPLMNNYAELEKFIESTISKPQKTEVGVIEDCSIVGVRQEDLGEDRKIICIGDIHYRSVSDNVDATFNPPSILEAIKATKELKIATGPKEEFCYKLISFMQGKTEYIIYTNEPVYICSDEGRTIEIVR